MIFLLLTNRDYSLMLLQQPSEEMKSHSISGLIKKNRFPDIPTVLTPYLHIVGLPLTLPVPVAADELAGNIPFPEPVNRCGC